MADIVCRMGVKNGRKLEIAQMRKVVRNLSQCHNRHVCPHGRPIAVELDLTVFAKLFGRWWIPERLSADEGMEEVREEDSTHERWYPRSGVFAE